MNVNQELAAYRRAKDLEREMATLEWEASRLVEARATEIMFGRIGAAAGAPCVAFGILTETGDAWVGDGIARGLIGLGCVAFFVGLLLLWNARRLSKQIWKKEVALAVAEDELATLQPTQANRSPA